MNLRDIKKDIEYVIGAFIDDCSLFSALNQKADDEALGGSSTRLSNSTMTSGTK